MIWGIGKKKKAATRKRPRIDYDELQWALLDMKEDWHLFKMIKAEMKNRGHWKAKPRGSSFQDGYDPRRVLRK